MHDLIFYCTAKSIWIKLYDQTIHFWLKPGLITVHNSDQVLSTKKYMTLYLLDFH